jgi:pre-mRNA-splicing factor 38A
MYIRMTFRSVDVYELLEPLLKDYRKLRLRSMGALLSVSLLLL